MALYSSLHRFALTEDPGLPTYLQIIEESCEADKDDSDEYVTPQHLQVST